MAVFEGIICGIIANKVPSGINKVKDYYDTLVRGESKEAMNLRNDNLQRAIYKSYLYSLLKIYESCIIKISEYPHEYKEEKKNLKVFTHLESLVKRDLKTLDTQVEFDITIDSIKELRFLLVANDTQEFQDVLHKIKQIPSKYSIESELFQRESHSHIYDLLNMYFANEIKQNSKVKAIFDSQLNILTNLDLENVKLAVNTLASSAEVSIKRFDKIDEMLVEIRGEIRSVHKFISSEKPIADNIPIKNIPIHINQTMDILEDLEEMTMLYEDLEYHYSQNESPLINFEIDCEKEILEEINKNKDNRQFVHLSNNLLKSYEESKKNINNYLSFILSDEELKLYAAKEKQYLLKSIISNNLKNIINKKIVIFEKNVHEIYKKPPTININGDKQLVCTDFFKDGFTIYLSNDEYEELPEVGMVTDDFPRDILMNKVFPKYLNYKFFITTNTKTKRKVLDLYHFAFSKNMQP